MSRPRHIWFFFGLCLTVLLAAMGWVSWTALRLDDAQRRAAQQAELEEKVRLALWRMDSALAPVILEESGRPYQNYESFATVSRAYKKGGTSYAEGDVRAPSPLLSFTPGHVRLHFQFESGGPLTSPQVPVGPQRALAERNYTTGDAITAAAQKLVQLQQLFDTPTKTAPASTSSTLSRYAPSQPTAPETTRNRDLLVQRASSATNQMLTPGVLEDVRPLPPTAPVQLAKKSQTTEPQAQQLRSQAELNARANVYQQAQQRAVLANEMFLNSSPTVASRVKEGFFAPMWLGPELLLVRRIDLENRFLIQGCWLDWPTLKQSLLASVADLFPHGELEPTETSPGRLAAGTLAALPAKLLTGPAQLAPLSPWSPVRFSLVLAWAGMLLAGGAVALLLHGTLSLSERRAAFVSAVTHELRTPLTTFKMYSEMLAADMVPDEQKRRHYLETLCAEANRLGHLVENVLAYARLERGSARQRVEVVPLEQLLDRVKDRLEQRAQQAGLSLEVEATPEAHRTQVRADVSAVEQILFNLVDNACKYAASSTHDARLHLQATSVGKVVSLRVRDHGPGIPAQEAKRVFEPFHKSAQQAAHSAPGVGLGLALCRRLSRAMGGDLRLDCASQPGACFVLELPVGPAEC